MAKNSTRMFDIIPDDIKMQLTTARAIEDDNQQLATAFYREIVRQADINDLLPLFYGENAYELINECADAINGFFIMACAKNAYQAIRYKTAMGEPNAWATFDRTQSNDNLKKFFKWVGTFPKRLLPEDSEHFKELLYAMQDQTRYFNASEYVQSLAMVEIVRNLSNGQIKLQGNALK